MATSGSLSQLTVPEILRNLLEQQLTGKLRVTIGPFRKVVYFDQGHPVFATSTDPADGLGEVLVRQRRITPEQLRDALGKSPTLRDVGKTLVTSDIIRADELAPAVERQAHEIILSLFTVPEGSFVFEPADLAAEDVIRLKLKTETILKAGAKRMTNPRLLIRALGSLETTLEVPAEERARVALALEPKEEILLAAIRNRRQSVRELCERSKLPALDTCQALVAMVAAGAARRV